MCSFLVEEILSLQSLSTKRTRTNERETRLASEIGRVTICHRIRALYICYSLKDGYRKIRNFVDQKYHF